MNRVSVITGGAGGMGRATAEVVGRDHTVVLCDVRRDRLAAAAAALQGLGISPTVVDCDVTDRRAVAALFDTANGLGTVVSVIHAAGVSPSMGAADYVMRTNALGTLHVNEVFHAVAGEGAVIVNVASMAAHLLPAELIPAEQFPLALRDADAFLDAMMTACDVVPEDGRSGIAYAVSKSFVRWYSQSQAERFNARGLRIVSVSPGSIDTEMGRLEEQAGAGAMVTEAAVPRWGRPEEMAELLAFCASAKAGYLTGTDILNDGGVIASMTERARAAAANG
ncbi:SDR family oxidoreductase [Mycobacterium helveticum]|jgi:NAD(P)-dependent dehydrogenase (short-subunit alcohol dehydrogenase family)|uniref:SDR family oxidoreductase n=1 Tax=Mycobacterium helveticum TaxID=2592811 RepID=A0A557XIW8_9MYCO|nr:SDR family oxidoreductase [Mycobacterium helveticum]TVS84042.1 SDR family oxidoreductase [Mycobacterium helveticum]TVS85656.1 SDR family oxidoreductase [Mycobacterium helveticum]